MYSIFRDAEVSELADEQDSGSCERYAREGSSPFFRIGKRYLLKMPFFIKSSPVSWKNLKKIEKGIDGLQNKCYTSIRWVAETTETKNTQWFAEVSELADEQD